MRIFVEVKTSKLYSADDMFDVVLADDEYHDILMDEMYKEFDSEDLSPEDWEDVKGMSFDDLEDSLRDEIIDRTYNDFIESHFDYYDTYDDRRLVLVHKAMEG